MVEDTVAAMSILQTYTIQLETSSNPGIDVGLDTELHIIRVFIGAKIMACLPKCIQQSQTTATTTAVAHNSSTAGVYSIPICPVFFTQGIDIQQSGTTT